MKQLLTYATVMIVLIIGGQASKAQSITGSFYMDSCNNFSNNTIITYAVTSATAANYTACRIETSHGDGTRDTATLFHSSFPISTPPWTATGYGSGSWHTYTVPGVYTAKKVLINAGLRVDSVNMIINIACTMIGGNLYQDANSNCSFNWPTERFVSGMVYIKVDSAGVPVDTLSASSMWRYAIRATAATTYKFTLLGNPASYAVSCPSTGVYTYGFNPVIIPPTNLDFGYNCSATPAYDYGLTFGRALRGASSPASSFIRLQATNYSCHSGTGTVTLNVSPKYSINSTGITPTPSSVSGNTVTWSVANMAFGAHTYLFVPLTPLSTTSNGDTACNSATITPTAGDGNLSNNSIAICDSVRASWDPNEKSVFPAGPVSAGALLTYTIDFENLGNDTAFNIHVQDTLSQHLDASSFKIISSTHAVTPIVYEIAGGSRVIKFDFPGINLEDKTVPTRNKGQVRFTINMKSGLPTGTRVANRAGIYFDGNEVVLTNFAHNNIPVPASVPGQQFGEGVTVFPNPATDAIYIRTENGNWTSASLINAVGQTVSRTAIQKGDNVLSVQNLPAGIYYLQLSGSGGTHTEKVEKQ